MKRSEGERIRLKHSISRLRAGLDSLESALKIGGPAGNETAGALITAVTEIALQIAKLDAFELVEKGS